MLTYEVVFCYFAGSKGWSAARHGGCPCSYRLCGIVHLARNRSSLCKSL